MKPIEINTAKWRELAARLEDGEKECGHGTPFATMEAMTDAASEFRAMADQFDEMKREREAMQRATVEGVGVVVSAIVGALATDAREGADVCMCLNCQARRAAEMKGQRLQ